MRELLFEEMFEAEIGKFFIAKMFEKYWFSE